MPDDLNFEPFASDGACDKLLPSNAIKKKVAFYRITSFEYPRLFEEVFEVPEGLTVWDGGFVGGFVMGLPLWEIARADLLHEQSDFLFHEPPKGKVGLAVANTGTFLPINDERKYRDASIRKVVIVDDEDEIREGLTYRGSRINLSDDDRQKLLDQGQGYATLATKDNAKVESKDRVKILFRPTRSVNVKDLNAFREKRELASCENAKIRISDAEIKRLAERGVGFGFVDNKPVEFKQPRDRQGGVVAFSINVTGSAPFLQPDHVSDHGYCARLLGLLSDPRAPEEFAHDVSATQHVRDDVSNLDDEDYFYYLGLYLKDSRRDDCLEEHRGDGGLLAPNPGLPVYEVALLSTYEQEWELLGYSKGQLISSINLAPKEQMQIEVFTWDKQKLEQEKTFGSEYEFNREINNLAKLDTTIARDLKESLNAHLDGNGSIGLQVKKLNVGGNVDAGVASEVQTGMETDVNMISEGSVKSSEKFKATHRVKIVETHEFGEENRTIRKIENPNASRTLTFNYFEILENYCVTTRLHDATQFCLLVQNPELPAIDIDFLMAYEYRLQQVLLSPNYKSGFEAARKIAAHRWFEGQSAIQEEINRPSLPPVTPESDAADDSPESNAPQSEPPKGIYASASTIYGVLTEFIKLDIDSALQTLSAHHNPLGGGGISLNKVQSARTELKKYSFWLKLTNVYPGFDAKAKQYVKNTKNKHGKQAYQPRIVEELRKLLDSFDDDWLFSVKMFAASTVAQAIMKLPLLVTGPFAPVVMGVLEPIILDLAYAHEDLGLSKMISNARKDLHAIVDTQNAVIAHDQVKMPAPPAAEQQPAVPVQVPQLYSLRELAEAQADFNKLITHIEKHRVYYTNEIWRTEDENQRYVRLELMGIAPFVENRLLGFAGTKAIYPLRVEALPDSVDLSQVQPDLSKEEDLVREKEELISLPTAGVHMETLRGHCEALEPYLLERRKLDMKLRKTDVARAKQRVEQAKLENERLRARLDADPPHLGSPYANETDTET